MGTLILRIKKEHLDDITSGKKSIDYRDCTEYWVNRLVEDVINSGEENEEIVFTKFDKIKFLCGKIVLEKTHVKTELDEENGEFQIYFS